MITRADKGNCIVVLPKHQYETKIQEFIDCKINRNSYSKTTSTQPPQTQPIRSRPKLDKTIKDSTTLIPKDCRWKYINMNPSAPSIKGQIKIHKLDQPI